MQKAFYRCSFGVIQRSKGDSVVKKAAYNARKKIYQKETDKYINYSSKQDLLAEKILAPKDAKAWVFDRKYHYNEVEKIDNRCNSQLGRTLDVGLLHQLTLEQNQELLEQYLRNHLVSRGMVADYCIHAPEKDGDQRNIHAHIILSMRKLDGDSFNKKKAREWNEKNLLKESRIAWAIEANAYFNNLGLPFYIDHRSLKDQGIDRLPQRHEGKWATNLKRRKGVSVAKVTYNDLVKEMNQINDAVKKLMAEHSQRTDVADRAKRIRQYEELMNRCIVVSEKAIDAQEAETNYWIRQRELEGVMVEVEQINIADQYFSLREKGILLLETLEREIKRNLLPDDEESQTDADNAAKRDRPTATEGAADDITKVEEAQTEEESADGRTDSDKYHQFELWNEEELEESSKKKSSQDKKKDKRTDFEKWRERAEAKAERIREGTYKEEDSFEIIEPEPPDSALESSKQPLITGDNSRRVAEHTELEALTKAQTIRNFYKSTKNRKPQSVVTAYRLKLAQLTAKIDPETIAKEFHEATPTALDYERQIRQYLRRRGFNDIQIRGAMRKASPALYKQSEQQARRYARRLDVYLRQKQQKEQQQKQQQNRQQNQHKKRRRGRSR